MWRPDITSKKPEAKKLKLNRETLRRLGDADLERVAGGGRFDTGNSDTIPTTCDSQVSGSPAC